MIPIRWSATAALLAAGMAGPALAADAPGAGCLPTGPLVQLLEAGGIVPLAHAQSVRDGVLQGTVQLFASPGSPTGSWALYQLAGERGELACFVMSGPGFTPGLAPEAAVAAGKELRP